MSATISASEPAITVSPRAFLTLHYRLASTEGDNIINTFDGNPATLQMGMGQLAPELEAALIGLAEGSHTQVELTPEKAFGLHNPDLVQQVSKQTLKENSAFDENYAVGDLVEFNAPSGGRFAGILRSIGPTFALFDFNHPLAGKSVVFETKIISIL